MARGALDDIARKGIAVFVPGLAPVTLSVMSSRLPTAVMRRSL